jgi:hypothetical protein
MDNQTPQPFVTIHYDIIEDTDDSDATVTLVTPT